MPGFLMVIFGVFVGVSLVELFRFLARQKTSSTTLTTLGISERLDALLRSADISFAPYSQVPDRVAEAIGSNRKLDAIRLYRESSGLGLKESKDFIENLMSPERQIRMKLDALLKHSGISFDDQSNVPSGVLEALRRGQKIEAIRLYRESTHSGLKEAKERVEEIERERTS
jgi:ribosomal protein L7/L12